MTAHDHLLGNPKTAEAAQKNLQGENTRPAFPLGQPIKPEPTPQTGTEWARVENDGRVTKLDIEGARRACFDEEASPLHRAVAALVLAAYQRGREAQ